jgi:hypothetical protein
MPNWCENSISITGNIEQLKKDMQSIPEDYGLFKTLIGIDVSEEQYKTDWYESNIRYWGTKWDVDISELHINYDESEIYFSLSTAWSPPLNFCKVLSEKYGVDIEIEYSEGGCDFAGKGRYKNGIEVQMEEYYFIEGLYYLQKENFWNEIEWRIDNAIEDGEDANVFIEEYDFVDEKDKNRILEMFNQQKKEFHIN